MAISFVAKSQTAIGGTGLSTGTEPTGTAQNDIMVAIALANATPITGPSGWTRMPNAEDGPVSTFYVSTWYIVRGASAPSFTWAASGYTNGQVSIATYRGEDTAAPIDASGASATGSAVSPSVTTSFANGTLVCTYMDISGTATAPPSMTLRTVTTSACIADLGLGAAGPTGTKTWQNTTTPVGAFSVALKLLVVGGLVYPNPMDGLGSFFRGGS